MSILHGPLSSAFLMLPVTVQGIRSREEPSVMTICQERQRWAVVDLRRFAEAALGLVGVPSADAAEIADALLSAEMSGIASHGLALLPRYLRGLRSGQVNSQPHVTIQQRGAVARVDGDNGLGYVVARAAMDAAIEAASRLGVGAAVVRNSNHFGVAGRYVKLAAERDMIGFVTTNCPAVLAPWGGRTPVFGNNPLAWGIPTPTRPLVFDMACSVVTRTRIRWAAEAGQRIRTGWALDPLGQPTEDPVAALNGSLMPVGEHKGSGLALINECLAGALPDALMTLEIPNRILSVQEGTEQDRWGVGHFLLALNVEFFMEIPRFKGRIARIMREVKDSEPAAGKRVVLPGELEAEKGDECQRQGVPLTPRTERLLIEIAAELRIDFPGAVSSYVS
jgi:L-2-hydroxycarboxylate dehydrogenase (NAD+)